MATLSASDPRENTVTLASASAGPIEVGFRLFSEDIKVYVDYVETSAYTLSASFENGFEDDATITFDAAQDSGSIITIQSDFVPERGTNFLPSDAQLTDKMNVELGHLWGSVADDKRDFGRALKFAPGDGANSVLPALQSSSALIVNAAGDGFEMGPTAAQIEGAEAAAVDAANSFDEFSRLYLGTKSSDPATDNEGDALQTGALYYNDSDNEMRQYNGAAWETAYGTISGADGALLSENNLSDVANAESARGNLGLTIGTHVQGIGDAIDDPILTGDVSGNALSSTVSAVAGIVHNRIMTPVRTREAIEALAGQQKVETITLSGDASVDITLPSMFRGVRITLDNVIPSSDEVYLMLRTSSDGGSTFDSGASDYDQITSGLDNIQEASDSRSSLSAVYLTTFELDEAVGSSTFEDGVSGDVEVFGHGLSRRTHVRGNVAYYAADGKLNQNSVWAFRTQQAAVDAVRLSFDTGNLESGTITVYGVA
jgi:hypothetical protein